MMNLPGRSDNIPIIFVPGTSGTSLDINPNGDADLSDIISPNDLPEVTDPSQLQP